MPRQGPPDNRTYSLAGRVLPAALRNVCNGVYLPNPKETSVTQAMYRLDHDR